MMFDVFPWMLTVYFDGMFIIAGGLVAIVWILCPKINTAQAIEIQCLEAEKAEINTAQAIEIHCLEAEKAEIEKHFKTIEEWNKKQTERQEELSQRDPYDDYTYFNHWRVDKNKKTRHEEIKRKLDAIRSVNGFK